MRVWAQRQPRETLGPMSGQHALVVMDAQRTDPALTTRGRQRQSVPPASFALDSSDRAGAGEDHAGTAE